MVLKRGFPISGREIGSRPERFLVRENILPVPRAGKVEAWGEGGLGAKCERMVRSGINIR